MSLNKPIVILANDCICGKTSRLISAISDIVFVIISCFSWEMVEHSYSAQIAKFWQL